jgi:hypothetical protein
VIFDLDPVLPVLTGAVMAALFVTARYFARGKTDARILQLERSAEMLALHADMLKELLASHILPHELKSLLITSSDAVGDKDTTIRLAEAFADRSIDDDVVPSQETRDALSFLGELKQTHPEIAHRYASAILCGTVGAMLRWPESAALFEAVGTRIAADGDKRGIDMAVVAAGMRAGLPFAFRSGGHAVAA